MFRKPRALDDVECRVLGALLEKEQVTPEYYPMTLPSLVAATNQKTNREPVMELGEEEVRAALERLFKDVFVWREAGPRAVKWSHNLDRRWGLAPSTKAAITLLLLRGPQTPGEIRGRAERLFPFSSIADAEAALAELAAGDEPLVQELSRAPGQKENRWRHLLGVPADHTSPGNEPAGPAPSRPAYRPPVEELLERLERMEARLRLVEAALSGRGQG
jgi:uncharacterized protein YceH (UPF0502 family)